MGEFIEFIRWTIIAFIALWFTWRFLWCVYMAGLDRGVENQRTEAVEAGVAEWVVTGSNGETEFRWIEPQQAGGEQP